MKSKARLLAATLISAPALSAAAWYNEPTYVNPGTEGLSLGLTPLAYPATNSNKFLGQYVCVDANDQPIPADPYTCTSSRRKLRIGEDLPYIRYSKTASGKLVEVSNSIPLVFQDRVRFLNTRHSNKPDRVLRNYRVGDGYDITDDYNGYAFIYGTRDSETTEEDFIWCGEFGKLGGGWMLWPNAIGAGGSDIYRIDGDRYSSCSASGLTYTVWEAPAWTSFTNGKTLYNVKTLHFSGTSAASSDQLEVFYQNSLYGGVRWEAWRSTPQQDGTECNGSSTMQFEGATFYRLYCHDFTNLQFQATPYHAYHNPLNTIFTTSPQRLKNSDFVHGTQSWSLETSQAGSITYAAAAEAGSGNPYLAIDKVGPGVVSVVQTVAGLGSAAYEQPVLQGGALLKGPPGAQGVIGVVLNSSRGSPEELKIRFNFKNSEWSAVRFHAESVHLTDPNVMVTYKFYPKANGSYAMDEAFLAVLPKSLP